MHGPRRPCGLALTTLALLALLASACGDDEGGTTRTGAGGASAGAGGHAAFEMTGADVYVACRRFGCIIDIGTSADARSVRTGHLLLETDVEVGTPGGPTIQDATITRATWIYAPTGQPMELSCASGGTLHYAHGGVTTVTLSGVTTGATCPGTPTEPSSLDIVY